MATGSINLFNSGLDVQGIVDSLIEVERDPIRRLEKRQKNFEKKVTAYGDFNSKLSSLLQKIQTILYDGDTVPLAQPATFQSRLDKSVFAARSATSSDETILKVATGKGAASGSYDVTVTALARARTVASAGFADTTTTETATGTLTINGTDITIDDSNNTLEGIRLAINNADAGATATIINVGGASPYRLSITSDKTGTENALTFTDGLTGGTGQVLALAQTVAAADAVLTVNGVTATKSSNIVSDVIPGLTLSLAATSASPVTVTVERDLDAITEAMKGFVDDYNEANTFITKQFKYDATTKTAGTLSGDSIVRSTQSSLQSKLTQSIAGASATFSVIGQLGIDTKNDGSLTFDEDEFREALETDPDGVARMMLGGDGAIGIMSDLQDKLDTLTDSLTGPIHLAKEGLNNSIEEIDDQIDDYEFRLEQRREILIAEYAKADQALRLLGVTQNSINGQTSALGSF